MPQYDTDPKHKSKITSDFLRKNDIKSVDFLHIH